MRLSTAIMIGITQTKLDAWSWDSCLIGIGFHALAGLQAPITDLGYGRLSQPSPRSSSEAVEVLAGEAVSK